jgi:hypothetical protein
MLGTDTAQSSRARVFWIALLVVGLFVTAAAAPAAASHRGGSCDSHYDHDGDGIADCDDPDDDNDGVEDKCDPHPQSDGPVQKWQDWVTYQVRGCSGVGGVAVAQ